MEPVTPERDIRRLSRKTIFLGIVVLIVIAGAAGLVVLKVRHNHTDNPVSPEVVTPLQTPVAVTPDWKGKWILVDSTEWENASITISSVTKNSFLFDANAQVGANVGDWGNYDPDTLDSNGTLTINGNVATFVDDKDNTTDDAPCTGTFTLSPDNKSLEVKTDCDTYYAGYGVTFEGTYRKDAEIIKTDLRNVQAFKGNAQAYDAFVALVGKDMQIFTDSYDRESQLDNEDSFDATVSSWFVAHDLPDYGSIVMVGKNNQVWAATLHRIDDSYVHAEIRYYTNVPSWTGKLPATIKTWAEDYDDADIVYENK